MTTITLPRATVEQALEALENHTAIKHPQQRSYRDAAIAALRAALAQEQAEPLTIERLRYALVASRIIPPAAVEDPDEYDDGVTLHRIEALHRRIT
jgi:hypothetical protein